MPDDVRANITPKLTPCCDHAVIHVRAGKLSNEQHTRTSSVTHDERTSANNEQFYLLTCLCRGTRALATPKENDATFVIRVRDAGDAARRRAEQRRARRGKKQG